MNQLPSTGRRMADLLPVGNGRVPILAEYPYYRADSSAWAKNLRKLHDLGADVITAYIPWRLHEIDVDTNGQPQYDFDGSTHPQRDIRGFLEQATDAGLLVILKPGPYVHGEIRLGGLPDRVTAFSPRISADGQQVTEELLPMPSAHNAEFADAAIGWLRAVNEQVIRPYAAPNGPIVGLQVGNEGIFGDIHVPMTAEDFSPDALRRYADATGEPLARPTDAAQRARWASWVGVGLRDILATYRDALDGGPPLWLNVPLAVLSRPDHAMEAWLARVIETVPDGVGAGNTSWVGNAASCDDSLASLWLGMRLHRTDTLEDNWGFTWSDESYARPSTPLYNAMLGLAWGSSTVSIYTACTTYNWAPGIGPDADAMRAEGKNPEDVAPPYCPGAPVDENGLTHVNATALRLLHRYSAWAGHALRQVREAPDAWLVTDGAAVAESAWPVTDGSGNATPTHVAVTAATRWMLSAGVEVDVASNVANVEDGALIVIGGTSMSRSSQRALAALVSAGRRGVIIGAVPERDEAGDECTVLARALIDTPDQIRIVPVDAADPDGSIERAMDALSAIASTSEDRVLVLRRRSADAEVIWLFNRAATAHDVRVGLGQGVAVRLAPHGAAALTIEDGTLQSFLIHIGPDDDGETETAFLSTGSGEAEQKFGRHTVGRRTEAGWQFWNDETTQVN